MYKTISENEFVQEFKECGRESNFSDYGLRQLYNYFEDYEVDSGEEIELDVIAICCEYTEYDSLEELQADYNDIETEDDLAYNTQVVCFEEDCIIIQAY